MENGHVSNNITHKEKETTSKTSRQHHALRNKEFIERSSLLDDLMENQHIATVYHFFLALLLGSVIHLTAHQYFHSGEFNFGQKLIIKGFTGFHKFVPVWISLFLSNFLVYYGFKCWATIRVRLLPSSRNVRIWDYVCVAAFIVYIHVWLWFFTWFVLKQGMSILLALIATVEITRLLMKLYAFVRSNAPRVLKYKPHTEDDTVYPTFSQFMYFLWIPALVYRDTYPRTKNIRWKYVATKIAEFIAGIIFLSVLVERYIIASLEDYGKKPVSLSNIAVLFTENAVCGVLFSLTAHFLVLHVWIGAFAEICRFGDRLFYQDWWTSTNFERFYRTWNGVIHDWLYTYVYKDFYEIVFPGNKAASKYGVFFISAIFHEYILYAAFGFVLPIVFIQFFFISTVFTYIKLKPDILGNVLIWYFLGFGNGINITVFGIEYFSRVNCPVENSTTYSYMIPRLLSCGIE